jgi:hypothetical protein
MIDKSKVAGSKPPNHHLGQRIAPDMTFPERWLSDWA